MVKNLIGQTLTLLFLTGVGTWLALYGWVEATTYRKLLDHGVPVQARVLEHSNDSYSRRSKSYSLKVEYTLPNQPPVARTFAVDGTAYHNAVETGTTTVRYLRSDPEVCRVGMPAILPYQILCGLGTMMLVAAGVVLGLIVSGKRRESPR